MTTLQTIHRLIGMKRNVIRGTEPVITDPVISNNIVRDFIKRTVVLLGVLFVTAATAWAGKPVLNIEVCKGSFSGIQVKGWAYDPDQPNRSIQILYAFHRQAKVSDFFGYRIKNTNVERADVNLSLGITGKHGFSLEESTTESDDIPEDGSFYVTVVAFGLSTNPNNIPDDGSVYVTVPVGPDYETTYETKMVTVGLESVPRYDQNLLDLTAETEVVEVGDGCTIRGTGGENTAIVIEAGATVTLSGADLSKSGKSENKLYRCAGIMCKGDATIILADGTTNRVQGYGGCRPGIQPGPPGTTLTIKGNGSLYACGGRESAAIGSSFHSDCGNIVIEDCYIYARTGFTFYINTGDYYAGPGEAAGIGAGKNSSCGNITISGSIIEALSSRAAGIGSCDNGTCGDITITESQVEASGGFYAAGIGSDQFGSCGNITINHNPFKPCHVKAFHGFLLSDGGTFVYISAPYGIGRGYGTESVCGTVTIDGVNRGDLLNPYDYAPTNVTYTISFDANGGEGSMDDQQTTTNKGTILNINRFTLKDYVFVGWNTKPDGSGAFYRQGAAVNNLGDITLYAQWHYHIYTVSFDANGGEGTMDDQDFEWCVLQALSANKFTRYGYSMIGWNTKADGTGKSYANGEVIINPEGTLYAQWEYTKYVITYVDAEDGVDGVINNNPTTYTMVSDDITVVNPIRAGFSFDGWTWEGQPTPTKEDITIPSGTMCDKTYTAHWTQLLTQILTPSVLYRRLSDGSTLSGTGGSSTHIVIEDGATVTLSGVDITLPNDYFETPWAGITCEGDATIILADGTNNTVTGGYQRYPGILVPAGKTLTIRGDGSLSASCNQYLAYEGAAGIGSHLERDCGNIVIEGGTINATGGYCSAGIGGSRYAACGDITITSDVTSVTVTSGMNAPYCLGAGRQGGCGTVTVGGYETGSIAQKSYTYTPAESVSRSVTFDANGGTGTMEAQTIVSNIPTKLNHCIFTREGYIFSHWNSEENGSGDDYSDEQPTASIPAGTLYAQWREVGSPIMLLSSTGSLTLKDGDALTGTGGGDTHVVIADGATVTLSGVTINAITEDINHTWAAITCEGDATIILAEGTTNTLKGTDGFSSIQVPQDHTLTIRGTGTLNATGNNSAGIGSGFGSPYDEDYVFSGNIVIEGGIINAIGSEQAAGIGSCTICGNITISGGIITATGGDNAAGIGTAYGSRCGDITITGGIITATGGDNSAGIGGPGYAGCGDITITESITTVKTIKSTGASRHIGTDRCGTITITPFLMDETDDNTRTLTSVGVVYFDANGDKQICYETKYVELKPGCTLNDNNVAADTEQWLLAKGDVDFNDVLNFYGNTHLILADDATLSIINSSNSPIHVEGTLNIYESVQGTGRLIVSSEDYIAICAQAKGTNPGDINIYGGNVVVNAYGNNGIQANNNVNIFRGSVIANSTSAGIYAGNTINFNCGQVNASSLHANTISMDWTNTTDQITAGSYNGTVSIANNKIFTEDGHYYVGTLDSEDQDTIATKTLRPTTDIDLANTATNTNVVSCLDKVSGINVTLNNRSFFIDDDWNTLCLPFDIDNIDVTPLAGATIKELDGSTSNLTDGTLTLNFTDATSIEAGKPYIVKWDNTPALIISSDAEWKSFADNVNNGTEDYVNKMVKLAADINVSEMVGTNEHPFRGTFDGDGHTMTLDIIDDSNQGTAPFRYISGATIMNVKTVGEMLGYYEYRAGLVGFAKDGTNSIKNCEVAATIMGGDNPLGGVLGHGKSSNTTISDCLFSGYIELGGISTGIICGEGDKGGTHTIVNCLAAGTYFECDDIELIHSGGTQTITNCYRKTSGGSLGTDASSMTASELANALGNGWEIVGDNVVPKKNDDGMPPIASPVFCGVTIDAEPKAVDFDGGSFKGTYDAIRFGTENRNLFFVGDNNTLYYPQAGAFIGAFRAFFQMNDASAVRAINLCFDGETTGIRSIEHGTWNMEHSAAAEDWYTLDGRRLSGKPTSKGFYINNGRKVVIK